MNAPILPPRPATPLLDRVRIPADLRNYSAEQLRTLADELRAETIDAVSTTADTVVVRMVAPTDLPLRVPGVGTAVEVSGTAASVIEVSD